MSYKRPVTQVRWPVSQHPRKIVDDGEVIVWRLSTKRPLKRKLEFLIKQRDQQIQAEDELFLLSM